MTTITTTEANFDTLDTLDTLDTPTRFPPLPPPLRRRRAARAVVYPVRDGKPMAETDKHADLMVYAKEALRLHYQDRAADVYVSGNNFVFWEEGNPKARVSPDVYVVYGIPMRQRDSYKIWEEGNHFPGVVIELTSRKTQADDVGSKLRLYEQTLRVPEYYLFDPTGDYLVPRLRGYHLVEGRYVAVPLVSGDRIYSPRLGLDLVMIGETLRFWNPATGLFLPTLPEAEAQRQAEAERARTEAERAHVESERARAEADGRRDAEDEVARLRAELDALRRRLAGGGGVE